MYKRHSNWDEDKWDIHSDKSSYAGHKPGGPSPQDYHKSEAYSSSQKLYGSSDKPEDKLKDDYRSAHKEEDKETEKEKEQEDQEKTITDTVEKEEKKQKEEEQIDEFKSVAQEIKKERFEDIEDRKDNKTKRKQHNSIEEAINKAVKEEKETVFID